MDSMTALDASFLYMEDETQPMHIAVLATFEGPPPAAGEIEEMLSAKLHRVPRYRQKLQFVPYGLGRPVWRDDERFDLAYHVRRTAIPKPGTRAQLDTLMGRVVSQGLDPARPLWELWIVEGLDDGRWALISKVHHCMVDGVGGVGILATLLDTEPEGEMLPAVPWEPEAKPSGWSLARDAVRDGLTRPRDGLKLFQAAMTRPVRSLYRLAEFADGLSALRDLADDPVESCLNGPIGGSRRWHSAEIALSDIDKIRTAHGGTVNDVVLTAVTAAFRRLLVARGEATDGLFVRSLVPVSIRDEALHGALHNRVATMFVDLPMTPTDPLERFEAVRRAATHAKEHHQAEATSAPLDALTEFTPPLLLSAAARMLRHLDQHAVQTVTTNVPGPRRPLYAAGRRMIAAHPFVPIFGSVRTGIAVFSYAGRVGFGVTADYEKVRDAHLLTDGIEAEIEALLARC